MAYSATIPLYVGETGGLEAPDAVSDNGYIDNAVVLESDKNLYVDTSNPIDVKVTVIGYFSYTATVKIRYVEKYTYNGHPNKVDHDIEYKITTKYPTIKPVDSEITISVGEKRKLEYTVTPSGLLPPPMNWGAIDYYGYSLGYIDMEDDGYDCYVTGKKAGKAVVAALPYGIQAMGFVYIITVVGSQKAKLILSASPSGGKVTSGTTVTLTTKANGSTVTGCDIYFTTDGSKPSRNNGSKYSSGITINSACTLKAIAYKSGYETSDLLTTSYTIAPIEGIIIDEANFPDASFRNWLLSQSFGADGILTEREISNITSISVSGSSSSSPGTIRSLKGIEYFTSLTILECSYNQLTSLEISNNTALTSLTCHGNQLTTLDVSNNTALTFLGVSQNKLTTLDVTKNKALQYLSCNRNKLTALDVSANTELRRMQVFGNAIKGVQMDAFVASMPVNNEVEAYTIEIVRNDAEEKNICTKAQVAALKAKGWKPLYWNGTEWTEYEGCDKMADEIAITIPASGYATFYSLESAYKLPNGLSASVVKSAGNGKLTYETIVIIEGSNMNIVPRGLPVMLESNNKQAGTFTLTPVESGYTYSSMNLLRGSDEATTTTGDGYHYKLSYGSSGTKWDDVFGWYWGAQSGAPFQIEGHKAWLVVPRENGTRAAGFSVEGEALGIDAGDTMILHQTGEADIFDLQGRRVSQPAKKGIYIRNGKKVVNQ